MVYIFYLTDYIFTYMKKTALPPLFHYWPIYGNMFAQEIKLKDTAIYINEAKRMQWFKDAPSLLLRRAIFAVKSGSTNPGLLQWQDISSPQILFEANQEERDFTAKYDPQLEAI